jgi:hypothetical protein
MMGIIILLTWYLKTTEESVCMCCLLPDLLETLKIISQLHVKSIGNNLGVFPILVYVCLLRNQSGILNWRGLATIVMRLSISAALSSPALNIPAKEKTFKNTH